MFGVLGLNPNQRISPISMILNLVYYGPYTTEA